MRECRFCEFWTRHNVGTCSQKIQTTEGNFVTPQTPGTYGCNIQAEDKSKFKTSFRQDTDGNIYISGNFSKAYLRELIEFIEAEIKEK
jgi:hypothetical protein